jgi:hypothetical protein
LIKHKLIMGDEADSKREIPGLVQWCIRIGQVGWNMLSLQRLIPYNHFRSRKS